MIRLHFAKLSSATDAPAGGGGMGAFGDQAGSGVVLEGNRLVQVLWD